MGAATQGHDRLEWPLLLDGEKGSNKWKRVTWDEALDFIEDAFADVREITSQ